MCDLVDTNVSELSFSPSGYSMEAAGFSEASVSNKLYSATSLKKVLLTAMRTPVFNAGYCTDITHTIPVKCPLLQKTIWRTLLYISHGIL
jgi:hypothetical protein